MASGMQYRAPGTGEIEYPESDGAPLGETSAHIDAIFDLLGSLRWFFRKRSDVFVAADLFLYYEEGEPASRVAPDILLATGVAHPGHRRTYRVWEEGVPPFLVVEVTSKSSRIEDLGTKRAVYELIGVQEYLVFDPLEEYLTPRFQAFRRAGDQLLRVLPTADGDHPIPALGISLRPEGDRLRLVDLATGEPAPSLEEATDRIEEAVRLSRKAAGETEEARAEAARARAEAARAEAEAARAEAETARAEAETARAEAETARAAAEATQAAAEAAQAAAEAAQAQIEAVQARAGQAEAEARAEAETRRRQQLEELLARAGVALPPEGG